MPLDLDEVLSQFNEDDKVWVLQDSTSKDYVTIPHYEYPGRRPIHFFLKQDDALAILKEMNKVNTKLRNKKIKAVELKLKQAIYGIALDKDPQHADSFVIHGPVEVFHFINKEV